MADTRPFFAVKIGASIDASGSCLAVNPIIVPLISQ
jgi:hypothetical protein